MGFFLFAILFAASMLGALATEDVDFGRTRYTIWSTIVLLIPASVLFIQRSRTWRAWWMWSYLMYLTHFWYGFFVAFDGDVRAVFAQQGALVAGTNYLLTGVWAISVLVSWRAQAGAWATWLHRVTLALALISAFIASVFLKEGVVRALGSGMAVSVVAAFVVREYKRRRS